MSERFLMIPDKPVDVDLDKRILRGVVFVTRSIASDGGIVLPDGLRTDIFERDAQILARHAMAKGEVKSPNIGRAVTLTISEREGAADVQFADTELGREYAYIYGVNEDRTAYARGWSFGWEPISTESWGLAKVRRELGPDYDPDLVPANVIRKRSVWVTTKGLLKEISATPRRADIKALTRAWEQGGIREAARLAHELQLDEATELIASMKHARELDRRRIALLERELAALHGEASPSAVLGDDGELVRELTALRDAIRNPGKTPDERGA